jgi:hypothetical protein
MAPLSNPVLLAICVFHLCALACAWGTRLAIDTRAESFMHAAFFAALAAVGAVTWSSHQLVPGLGIPSGATLIAMVLMAVVDFRRTQEPHPGTHPANGS